MDKVRKGDFEPRPKVESRIVFFRKRRPADKGFEDFVTSLFRHRRKKALGTGKRPGEIMPEEFEALYKQQMS